MRTEGAQQCLTSATLEGWDDEEDSELEVSSIHNKAGYHHIRHALSDQYNLSIIEPNIQVFNVDMLGDRTLTLRHQPHNNIPLSDNREEVLKHLHRLWGFTVKLETLDSEGKVLHTQQCPGLEAKD